MIVKENVDLSEILWYKIGGKARYVLECENKEDVLDAVNFIFENNIEQYFVVGWGSNLIFPDEAYDGAIIYLKHGDDGSMYVTNDHFIDCYAGNSLDSLINFSFKNHLVGLEWAGGLPGTVGAGVRGNVGAFGGEIQDLFVEAEVLEVTDAGATVRKITKNDMHFAYRSSLVKQRGNMIVLSALFDFTQATPSQVQEARDIYQQNIKYRKTNHPLEFPNCGSVFKNIHEKEKVEKILAVMPEIEEKVKNNWHGKVSMGYLIHKLGLTGYKVGDAQVSEKHNNFIVNVGHAKAEDVRKIITNIQKKFQDTFGFAPEVEVEIVKLNK